MAMVVEAGVYAAITVISLCAAVLLLFANRRFLKGELKRLVSWFVAASVALFFGFLFSLVYVLMIGTIYGSTFLVISGFCMFLAALFLIRTAFLLHDFSRIFGFVHVEKEFDHLVEKKVALEKKGK